MKIAEAPGPGLRPRSRFRDAASVLAAIVFLALLASRFAGDQPTGGNARRPTPVALTDIAMYQRESEAIAKGGNYYEVVASEHRQHNYPLKPFFTVRPPTLAVLSAALGKDHTMYLAQGLVCLALACWGAVLARERHRAPEVLGAMAAGLCGGFLTFFNPQLYHELWAGTFLCLSAAFYRPNNLFAAGSFALIAMFFREFAALYVGTFGIYALARRRWWEFAMWSGVAFAAAIFYLWHAIEVSHVVTARDLNSQGWLGRPGLTWTLNNIAGISLLRIFGRDAAFVFILVSLVGWLGYQKLGLEIFSFLALFVVFQSVFARPELYYWSFFLYPLLPIGMAFFPRYVMNLVNLLIVGSTGNRLSSHANRS